MSVKRFPYGGQAVLEGVMMRGLRQATVAVRSPAGAIMFKHEPLNVARRRVWENVPFLRGILMLWDALNLGTRALNFSATVAIGEEEEQPSSLLTTITLVLSLLFAIGLFFILPAFLASLAERFGATPLMREFVQGLIRLILFLGYIIAISRLPDIQRVFGYHGAEHKAINAYEAGAPLTVDTVKGFTLIHPRCGTSFLLVVFIVSFIVFAFVRGLPFWLRLLSHIPLIPLIAGATYELLRLSAANYHHAWVRKLVAPTLALQRLTTRPPDDSMIAVAIAALLPVLAADGVALNEYDASLAHGVSQPEGAQANAPSLA
ncbi:MAG: DUF1385 domain-containing protein [Roseiflexaceae bacterium]